MRYNLVILCAILVWTATLKSFSQKESAIWYFGERAGIDFNEGDPVPLLDGHMDQHEGCASIADKNGNLLFYTNGRTVWNKNHEIMVNGTGLMGHISATQSAIIIPHPGYDNLYYIFTVNYQISDQGLRFSIVDMFMDDGQGAITNVKNEYLIGPTEEKVTAVKHRNNQDVWVIMHTWDSDAFYAYLITGEGLVTTPVISNTGTIHSGQAQHIGYLRASPDGSKIAVTVRTDHTIELFDFNNETGEISNPIKFHKIYERTYGIEFSPNGSLLYLGDMTNGSKIYQFDLKAGSTNNIINSGVVIGTVQNQHLGALQLAPDSKIYVAKHDNLYGDEYLGVINKPNEPGVNCDFVENGFYLSGRKCIWGLPNFIQSYFQQINVSYHNTCFGDATQFILNSYSTVDSVYWTFGDPESGAKNQSTQLNPIHIFSSTGEFDVNMVYFIGNDSDTITQKITINALPEPDLGSDTLLCETDYITLLLEENYDSYFWQDQSSNYYYEATEPGQYWVRVTKNGCANSDTIMIDGCYHIFFPNVFTPNNDGYNDFFTAETKFIKTLSMKIFNRWGELLCELNNINEKWDGTRKGRKCAQGVYFWVANYTYIHEQKGLVEKQQTGSVTLYR